MKMEGIFESLTQKYNNLMAQRDPRTDDLFMMSTPWPSLIICVLYVYIVKIGGPKFMEKREPYSIRSLMMVYNLAMVVLSGYTCMEFGLSGWFVGYSFGCQPVDYSRSELAMRMVRICWLFYFTKFIELIDTIFFIMRKKYSQVTFLHVFHHGIMPISWWFGVKFVPGGFGTFHALLNSFIHFVMYTYYGLAAMGPAMQKYLWWKRYMTSMQIIQFIMVCIHSVQLLFLKDCDYPKLFVYWIGLYASIFLVMFSNFYLRAYRKPSHKQVKQNGSSNEKIIQNGTHTKDD